MQKQKAFTLAEVLITLVVIGIIAAITVPMIMANHRKTETASRLKKFYSTLSNAVKLAETEMGLPLSEWLSSNNNLVLKYLNVTEVDPFDDSGYNAAKYIYYDGGMGNSFAPSSAYILADGSVMGFDTVDTIYFDVNGDKKPNMPGRDIFFFTYVDNKVYPAEMYSLWTNIIGCDSPEDGYSNCPRSISREVYLDYCKNKKFCTGLVMADGWEFKDDYPYKL